jgi:hypothetical protein
MFDDASSGDKGESGGVDAKTDRVDSGRTEVDGKVIAESPESVVFKDEVLMSARNVYSMEGIG